MLLTDLDQLKAVLQIPAGDTSEDVTLGFYATWASAWIEELLDRPLTYQSRTEYYDGNGTNKLPLKARPVFTTPTIAVNVDESGAWGAPSDSFGSETALTWGEDFALKLDQSNGSSRCGLLIRLNDVWPRRAVRSAGLLSPWLEPSLGSIKVTYTAGYTPDTLPEFIRTAAIFLVSKMRHILPLGVELTSESYEERSISWSPSQKNYLLGLVRPLLWTSRNWSW